MSQEPTVGQYLREKMMNMAAWVEEEVGKENLTVDLAHFISLRSNTELCVIAEVIKGQSTSVFHEDWMGLLSAAEIPPDFYEVVQAVRKKDSMHEKFWRYMNLFVFVISNTDDN